MILMHVLKHIEQFNLLYKYAVFGKYFSFGKISVCDWLHDIDVDDGKLKVQAQDDEVNFKVLDAMKHPNDKKECFRVNVIDEVCFEAKKQFFN